MEGCVSLASVYRISANSKEYRSLTNGYYTDQEHRVVAGYENGDWIPPEFHVHHVNTNKTDNRSSNLEIVLGTKHNSDHMKGTNNPVNRFPDCNWLIKQDHSGENNGMYGKKHSDETKEKIGAASRDPKRTQAISEGMTKYHVWKKEFDALADPKNHTVVSIEYLEGEIEVYNGTVDETHRYYVEVAEDEGLLSANCGEQPLLPFESCNLGSINLGLLVDTEGNFNFDRLAYICKVAVRMLDNVIDMNNYPIPEIEEMSKLTRRIGVGVMGFHDMLIQMGIRYDSEEALEYAENIMSFIQTTVKMESEKLGKEKGYCSTGTSRNSAPTTIAPTGTISIIAGASSGIEPLFALAYTRNVMDQTRMVEAYGPFEAIARERKFWSESLMEELAKVGSISHLDTFYKDQIPEDVQRLFVTSHEIEPSWHVRMQAAFQNYCDNAVSKTINLPSIATIDDVRDAYIQSWKLECKGITIYRDGSKESQPMAVETRVGTPEVVRPDELPAAVRKVPTGHGHMYVTIANDPEGNPIEVFMTLGKAGGCVGTFTEALGRILSSALTYGVPVQVLADQLIGIQCPHPAFNKGAQILSVPDGIGQALGGRLNGTHSGDFCPECGGSLVREEGCAKCHECGYSSC